MGSKDLTAHVHLCGYSYHTEPFRQTYKHGLDTFIFRLQTEGTCTLTARGRTHHLYPGDLTMLQPGDVFDLRIYDSELATGEQPVPSGDYYVFCDGEWVREWWKRKERRPLRSKIAAESRIFGLWYQLILEKRRLDGGDAELVSSLLKSLCLMLDRAMDEAPSGDSASSFLAVRMKHYIEEHAMGPIRVEEVAKHVGLSVSRTAHLFKSHYGEPIMQYVQKLRLAASIELMRASPMTLEQVAESAGFGCYTYFHRIFKSHYGVSPGAFRKQAALLNQDLKPAHQRK